MEQEILNNRKKLQMEVLAAKQVNTANVHFPAFLIMFYSAVQYMNNADCCKLNASSPGVSL